MCLARFEQSHQIITFAAATELIDSINQYVTHQGFNFDSKYKNEKCSIFVYLKIIRNLQISDLS